MLGLRGKKAQGAGRRRFASGGLTPISLTLASLLLAACQVPQHPVKTANTRPPAQKAAQAKSPETAKPTIAQQATPLAATPAVAHGETIVPAALRASGDPKDLLGLDHTALR